MTSYQELSIDQTRKQFKMTWGTISTNNSNDMKMKLFLNHPSYENKLKNKQDNNNEKKSWGYKSFNQKKNIWENHDSPEKRINNAFVTGWQNAKTTKKETDLKKYVDPQN